MVATLSTAIKRRLRETYCSLAPVAVLAEIRAAQEGLEERIGKRGLAVAAVPLPGDLLGFARSLGTTAKAAEVRTTHRRQPGMRCPSTRASVRA
jgi:hypothetical protein